MGELNTYSLTQIDSKCLKIWGRTNGVLDPLTLFWTGSGIEVNVRASQLWLEIETDYDVFEQWGSVLVNGAHVSRQMLEKGRYWLCIFRNMDAGVVKNVRFMKDLQAMSDDEGSKLQIHAIRTDGVFETVKDRPYKIEFIGDSITSGEGTIGAKEENDWIPMFFSSVHDYASLVSDACNAECHIISQSGWGVLTGWDNNPNNALPKYYTQVCGLLKGERNLALGAQESYDFGTWQPDVVVVNLGTNDASAFDQPMWEDAESGQSFKQHKEADGTYAKEDAQRLVRAMVDFLKLLRDKNPTAHLIWAYGMLGTPVIALIKEAIYRYQLEENDNKISFVLLPDTTEETVGARCHPGKKSHERAAAVLADYIKAIL